MTELLQKIDSFEQILKKIEKRKNLLIHSLHDLRLELNTPIPITIEYDGYQFITYAPDSDIYGCGDTEYEAIEYLRQSIVELYFDLKGEKLGKDLQKIFEYLKTVINEK